ncbi:MAG: hypothetical protein M1828_002959 [Chrysothrix sp. TS-e1954]|nr:MAG: hypothetical protein M1828_002959 [Chrysothrix sp. TS-e1954]
MESGPATPTGQGPSSAEKPRLTEQEKKDNHIASEQKRRQAIREGFDEIADIVPGLKGQGRSEAIVLQGAVRHIRELLAERWRLVQEGEQIDPLSIDRYIMDQESMVLAERYASDEKR